MNKFLCLPLLLASCNGGAPPADAAIDDVGIADTSTDSGAADAKTCKTAGETCSTLPGCCQGLSCGTTIGPPDSMSPPPTCQ